MLNVIIPTQNGKFGRKVKPSHLVSPLLHVCDDDVEFLEHFNFKWEVLMCHI